MTNTLNLFEAIARRLFSLSQAHHSFQWGIKQEIRGLLAKYAPFGSGFDNGTKLDFEKSTPEKLVFQVGFHHMDDVGYYTEWTHHKVTVRASLIWGVEVSVSGRNVNDIKSHIEAVFRNIAQEKVSR